MLGARCVRFSMLSARPMNFSRAYIHTIARQTWHDDVQSLLSFIQFSILSSFFVQLFFLFQSFQVEIDFGNFHFALHAAHATPQKTGDFGE